jgi:hypothetical protein
MASDTNTLHFDGGPGYYHARGVHASYAIDEWPGVCYARVDITPTNELALGGLPAEFRSNDGLATETLDEAVAALNDLECRFNAIAHAPRLVLAQ